MSKRLFAVCLIKFSANIPEAYGHKVQVGTSEVQPDGTVEPHKVPLLTGTDYKEMQSIGWELNKLTLKFKVRESRESRKAARDARRLAKLETKIAKLQSKMQ